MFLKWSNNDIIIIYLLIYLYSMFIYMYLYLYIVKYIIYFMTNKHYWIELAVENVLMFHSTDLKRVETVSALKNGLKTYFFKQYFYKKSFSLRFSMYCVVCVYRIIIKSYYNVAHTSIKSFQYLCMYLLLLLYFMYV